MSSSFILYRVTVCVLVAAMLKHFSNFLRYLILVEGACVGLGAIMMYAEGYVPAYGLFIFLVLVACETSLALGLMVGIIRNPESGVYSLYSYGE